MDNNIKTLYFADTKIDYRVIYKTQKHMYLKIDHDQIKVTAPFFVSNKTIELFLIKNIKKIIDQLANNHQKEKLSIIKTPFIMVMNQKFTIKFMYHKQNKIYLSENNLFVYSPLAIDLSSNEQLLKNKVFGFLKKLAQKIFSERMLLWEKTMNLNSSSLKIRNMKSKWGVCNTKTAAITLNLKLMHFSLAVIDYVIIHELAHLFYPNHSLNFWQLVAIYCPAYKQLKKQLRE